MKTCRTCKNELPLDRFAKYKSHGKDYTRTICIPCRGKESNARNALFKDDPAVKARKAIVNRKAHWKAQGIDPIKAEAYYLSHRGLCDICGNVCSSGMRLAIDHDHSNGDIRGMLCRNCNTGLGFFKDSPELLLAAIQYLKTRQLLYYYDVPERQQLY